MQLTRALCPLLIASLALGCAAYQPTTALSYEPIATAPLAAPRYRVAVLPLRDERPPKTYPSFGAMFKSYIPFLPYFSLPYERLDESYIDHRATLGVKPPEGEHFTLTFAQAIARDLAQSGLFREVVFAPTEADAADADLVLTGALRSTEFTMYGSSYMLGPAGVILWLLPIPIGKDEAKVSLALSLRDREGRELWSHASPEPYEAGRLFTLYAQSRGSDYDPYWLEISRYGSNDLGIDGDSMWAWHAQALRAAMGDAKASLAASLAEAEPGAAAARAERSGP